MITSPELNLVFPAYSHKVKKKEGKLYIFEEITKKYRLLTPEEWVRQHCLHYLVNELNYPASLFQIEGSMKVDQFNRRTDIRLFKKNGEVFMLIECKAPHVEINLKTLQQISQYQKIQQAEYLVITNGLETIILHHSTKILNEFPLIYEKLLFIFLGLLSLPSLAQKKPALVVGIVVDQMRYEYLYKYYDRYSEKGFKRLIKEGINCTDNHYNYAPTVTAAGHASIYTGSVPAIHGIVENDWIDVASGKKVYCVDDSTVQTVGSKSKAGMMSPRNLFTSTITDQLKMAQNYKSKTIAISLKDRGSIIPGGHTADASYWYDSADGYWISSTFYMKELPTWVQKFNLEGRPQKYLNQGWNTLYPIASYTRSAEDDSPFEGKIGDEKTPTFPHDLKGRNMLEGFRRTPYGNSLLKEFALKALDEEKLGKNGTTDFLALSFSSTDYVGHAFGPQSIEVEDTYLRLDKDIAEILDFLDAKIGKNQYLVFLTADHAVADNQHYLKSKRMPGGTFETEKAVTEAKEALRKEFGDVNLIVGVENNQIYLNHANLDRLRISKEVVGKILEKTFKSQPGVAEFINMREVGLSPIPAVYREILTNGYNQARSGDFMYLLRPQWVSGYKTGASHSTVYAYDTHVPLLFFGWNIKPREISVRTNISDISSTLANWLKISEPTGSIGKVIQ